MCCHRFYIYSTCGHSLFSPQAIVQCQQASIPPDSSYSATCKLTAHPFQSWKIDSPCPDCLHLRETLLDQIKASQTIHYDDWRWKVSYGLPAHGKDFWGRKAEERERLERETGKTKRKSLPFRWKRTRKSKRGQVEIAPSEAVRCAPALLERRPDGRREAMNRLS